MNTLIFLLSVVLFFFQLLTSFLALKNNPAPHRLVSVEIYTRCFFTISFAVLLVFLSGYLSDANLISNQQWVFWSAAATILISLGTMMFNKMPQGNI